MYEQRAAFFLIAIAGIAPGNVLAQASAAPPSTAPDASSSTATLEPGSDADAQQGGLEEVTVTATRRVENLQRVSIAINAFSGSALQDAGITDTNELATQVPSLTIKSQFGTTNPNIFLRGVGSNDLNENASPTVGTYIDEVYLAAPAGQFSNFFDLERVEVLKGPQGTLYGKNTTGGAFNIITRKPSFDRVAGYGRILVGNYDRVLAEGALNLPLADNLAVRAAFISNSRDGYIHNTATDSRFNAVDTNAARLQVRWEPSQNHSFNLQLNASNNNSDKTQGGFQGLNSNLAPGCTPLVDCANNQGTRGPNADPFTQAYNTAGELDNDQKGAILRYQWQGESLTFTSLSGYNDADQFLPFDIDNSPLSLLASRRFSNTEQLSQELRLTSDYAGRLNFIAGLYYLDEDVEVTSTFEFFGNGTITRQDYHQDAPSYAGFLQLNMAATDRLSLNAGVRYTRDERHFSVRAVNETSSSLLTRLAPSSARIATVNISAISPVVTGQPLPAGIIGGPALTDAIPALDRDSSDQRLTGRVGVDFEASDDKLLYAYVARGYKAGGFNGGALITPLQLEKVDPEDLLAYELGFKTDWLEQRLRVNGAAFLYDYEDLQVYTVASAAQFPQVQGVVQVLDNAANASIKGLELDLTVLPVDSLRLSIAAAYLEAEYEDFLAAITPTTFEDRSGARLVGAPRFDLTASAQYDFEVPFGMVSLRGDFVRKGSRFFDTAQFDPLAFEAPSHELWNASLLIADRDGRLSARLFAENLTDETYITELVEVRALGFRQVFYGEPRTYGIEFAYNF